MKATAHCPPRRRPPVPYRKYTALSCSTSRDGMGDGDSQCREEETDADGLGQGRPPSRALQVAGRVKTPIFTAPRCAAGWVTSTRSTAPGARPTAARSTSTSTVRASTPWTPPPGATRPSCSSPGSRHRALHHGHPPAEPPHPTPPAPRLPARRAHLTLNGAGRWDRDRRYAEDRRGGRRGCARAASGPPATPPGACREGCRGPRTAAAARRPRRRRVGL